MKGGIFCRSTSIKVSITITALLCMTLSLLIWEKTPFIAFLIPPDQLDVLSPATQIETPVVAIVKDEQEQPPMYGTISGGGTTVKYSNHEKTYHVSAPPPIALSRESSLKQKEDVKNVTKLHKVEKGCNYAKGKWVPDNKWPLYSGSGCKQWLSSMWACRLMQREDFSFEKYRWQPQGCETPKFEASEFLERMQDKTIAMIGDSLGRQQFQSLLCMASGGKASPEVQNVGWEYGLVKARGALRPDGWAYRFPKTNTTILFYWSASLCELEPLNRSDPATSYAMHLDRPATFLKRYLPRFHVVVLNTGHHWNRGKFHANRWEMYVGGKPNIDKKLQEISNARNFTVHSIVKWLDSQLPKYPLLKAFFRSISPRHFVNGDWNTGGSCDNTIPLSSGSEVLQDGSKDHAAESAVKGTKVKLLDITALSELRNEGHISKYSIRAPTGMSDCLHWCLPGIPDTWNEILCAQV
ncbi:protein trichome birefringence-like 14 isoform X2 [Dioscorea cayenensis subsp. rotundata]|uniref:Protein trichome birefringence-like 14 isoform X2 n=1 Tax=Dioscorea cayennensis subsp. rotundata TaxID=55577 RepID=A0AB40D1K5_DIOCR|nr:protein trichome birefringence-like 14 isoform X2 [Dioscorea cayenensis subsp. rotundata]